MNPELPSEALDLAASAAKAFADLGGVDLARRAEDDPTVRATEVQPALAALGVDDLDPRDDPISLAAAAALCEAAGRVRAPLPARRRAGARRRRTAHGDGARRGRPRRPRRPVRRVARRLPGRPPGRRRRTPANRLATRLGPFVTDLAVTDDGAGVDAHDLHLQLVLTAWSVLGTVDRAVELAVEHVNGRVQFGKPIAAFQAVQFQLADAAVAVAGLRQLAAFTLWRLDDAPDDATADVLALRLQALDVARSVLRTCQQLHGAAGVCDEYDISVLTRMVQPALRLPWSAERTVTELAAAIDRDGFVGLFPHGRPQ